MSFGQALPATVLAAASGRALVIEVEVFQGLAGEEADRASRVRL